MNLNFGFAFSNVANCRFLEMSRRTSSRNTPKANNKVSREI